MREREIFLQAVAKLLGLALALHILLFDGMISLDFVSWST